MHMPNIFNRVGDVLKVAISSLSQFKCPFPYIIWLARRRRRFVCKVYAKTSCLSIHAFSSHKMSLENAH